MRSQVIDDLVDVHIRQKHQHTEGLYAQVIARESTFLLSNGQRRRR
jgi:hypothetical protein